MNNYEQQIISYLNNPNFEKKLENYTHILKTKSKECGDWTDIYLFIDNGIIEEISYQSIGCALNKAILEIACSKLEKQPICRLSILNFKDLSQNLDFPSSKSHCIGLVLDTLQQELL